jgi:uridine kinase
MNIVQLIQKKFGQKSKPILILLAGGVGSGKTTLSNQISQAFEDKTVTVFSTDDYHMTFHTSQVNGFDPKSIDSKLLLSDLTKVLSGEDVYAPTVSRERDEKGIQFTRKDNAVLKKTAQIIILEGIHSLAFEDINKIAEIKV